MLIGDIVVTRQAFAMSDIVLLSFAFLVFSLRFLNFGNEFACALRGKVHGIVPSLDDWMYFDITYLLLPKKTDLSLYQ